jgi:hypothetical protein
MTQNRKFSPIFNASIAVGSIALLETKKGVPYAKSVSQVTLPSGQTVPRTVMAFGDQLSAVSDVFKEGATVTLAVQHDGGTMKIIGHPREKAPAEEAPEAVAA